MSKGKTASEIYEKANMTVLHPDHEDKIIELMEKFASQKCKEQREICADSFENDTEAESTIFDDIRCNIINAPSPTL